MLLRSSIAGIALFEFLLRRRCAHATSLDTRPSKTAQRRWKDSHSLLCHWIQHGRSHCPLCHRVSISQGYPDHLLDFLRDSSILYERKFFETVTPVNFNTIATPHIGLIKYRSWFSELTFFLGPRLLSRTGEQFYVVRVSLSKIRFDPDMCTLER